MMHSETGGGFREKTENMGVYSVFFLVGEVKDSRGCSQELEKEVKQARGET